MAERGRIWEDDEIIALLTAWGEESIQQQLLGAVRNVVPYRTIANELQQKGFNRDFKQCREKIKALTFSDPGSRVGGGNPNLFCSIAVSNVELEKNSIITVT